MEGFAAIMLGLGIMAAAHDAAYAPYRAGSGYYYESRPALVYAPAPSPLPAAGAVSGGLIGAAAAGAPGLVLGAVAGGITGDAISPRVVQAIPADAPLTYVPASPARSAESTDRYIRRWQAFMEPTPHR